jgi:hypothetical protein
MAQFIHTPTFMHTNTKCAPQIYRQNTLPVTAPCTMPLDKYYNSPPPPPIHKYEYSVTIPFNIMFCFHVLICLYEHKDRICMLNLHVLGYILLYTLFQQGEILWRMIMCLRQTRAQSTTTVDQSTTTMDQSAYVNTDVLKTFNTAKSIIF